MSRTVEVVAPGLTQRHRCHVTELHPSVTGGAPCIRGRQISVAVLADGMTVDEITVDLLDLTEDGVRGVQPFAIEAAPRAPAALPPCDSPRNAQITARSLSLEAQRDTE